MAQLNLGRVKGKSAYEVAVDNGFIGTETDWLNSIKGERGMVPIIDPATDKWTVVYQTEIPNNNIDIPTVNPTDNHWYVGQVDTGIENSSGMKAYISPYTNNWCFGFQTTVSAQGRSITSISTDSSNNVNVIFSDGTSSVVGTLTINVQADFLTSAGFGNMRYDTTTGKFQYTQNGGTTWNDIMMTFQNNTYIMNMIPQACKSVIGIYDDVSGYNMLNIVEPDDTYVDGQVACIVDHITIVRKLGSEPKDTNDGIIVDTIKRREFGSYEKKYYIDKSFHPNLGDIWYYKAFPVSTTGFENTQSDNLAKILIKDFFIYGITIDQNEPDPNSRVSYKLDYVSSTYGTIEVDNKFFKPASMDYSSNRFDYGSWKNAFFMQIKPCLLKQNGTVWKYLDPNNYSLFEDGTDASKYIDGTNNSDDDGSILNVMIRFPKTYFKWVDNGNDIANIYVSNKKLDNNFHCWAWLDMNGDEADFTYISAYRGYYDGNQLRSLSGKQPMHSASIQEEFNRANANNIDSDMAWSTHTYSDIVFINSLLMLIGKTTNSQENFGYGYCYARNTNASSLMISGKADDKGLFWGINTYTEVVKIFGIEHWWGHQYNRIAGCINDFGKYKLKLTYSTADGSNVNGYNFDGTNYINAGNVPYGTRTYISKLKYDNYGYVVENTIASSYTYYADSFYGKNSQLFYPIVGGACYDTTDVGAFNFNFDTLPTIIAWDIGASLSCKPLKSKK